MLALNSIDFKLICKYLCKMELKTLFKFVK